MIFNTEDKYIELQTKLQIPKMRNICIIASLSSTDNFGLLMTFYKTYQDLAYTTC